MTVYNHPSLYLHNKRKQSSASLTDSSNSILSQLWTELFMDFFMIRRAGEKKCEKIKAF